MDSRTGDRMRVGRRIVHWVAGLALLWVTLAASAQAAEPPRLVLQITVDQLRGDMLARYRDRFGEGGFRRLMDHGLWYANAHYSAGNTFTASGHAVLTTGADTPEHGMVANEWFDRTSGKVMYATADAVSPVLGEPVRPGAGLSPRNLTASTFGDELVAASAGRSRAYSVAGKDRSAIIPGGHRGKALWFSELTGGFVSSRYYWDALPSWVEAWNAGRPVDAYAGRAWTLLRPPESYRFSESAYGRPPAALGPSFPHLLPAAGEPTFLSALRFTPWLDAHTAAFARELIRREKLGRGSAPDYLAISFSGTDYIGHAFGPDSREYEDQLLRLDGVLAQLFAAADASAGRHRVLLVLSADHGADDIPEAARDKGYEAGRHDPDALRRFANAALRARFGVDADLVQAFVPPGFYLDRARMAELGLDPAAVEAALGAALRDVPGIAYAFARSDLLAGRIGRTPLLDRVARSFHPTRSGDVMIVQSPFWYLYPQAQTFAAMHGSPYSYDTHVPVILAGAGIPPRKVYRRVDPASLAPTLAVMLEVKSPSGAHAEVLTEALP